MNRNFNRSNFNSYSNPMRTQRFTRGGRSLNQNGNGPRYQRRQRGNNQPMRNNQSLRNNQPNRNFNNRNQNDNRNDNRNRLRRRVVARGGFRNGIKNNNPGQGQQQPRKQRKNPNNQINNKNNNPSTRMKNRLGRRNKDSGLLYLYGLSPETVNIDIMNSFSPYGKLKRCAVFFDRLTKESKCKGVVQFTNQAVAQRAFGDLNSKVLNLDTMIKGKSLEIKYATQVRKERALEKKSNNNQGNNNNPSSDLIIS